MQSDVAAIYVPLELEHDVEEWLKKKYKVKLLDGAREPSPTSSTHAERTPMARVRAQLTKSPIPQRCGSSPSRRGRNAPTKAVAQAGHGLASVQRSSSGSVWARLATPPKRREAAAEVPERPRSVSRRTDHSAVFDKLYRSGISQFERQQKAAEEARERRIAQEDAEIQRGKVLMRVLSCSDNYALSGAAFEQKMADACRANKLKEEDISGVVNRLSKKKSAPPQFKSKEDKELTFHPKISEPSTSTKQEIDERFNCLYKDAKKHERVRVALKERYEEKERKLMLERRLRDDEAFRKRVKEDPSVAQRYLASL